MHYLRPMLRLAGSVVPLAAGVSCAPGDTSGDSALTATFVASSGPWGIEPGSEKTECIVFRLDNPEGAFVRRFSAKLKDGSHHMTLYKSFSEVERRDPFPCIPFDSVPRGDRPIFISQQRETGLTFPSDEDGTPIGYRIEPRQMVRLEMHYVNASSEPLQVESDILIEALPLSARVVEADIAFWGTLDIQIPPNSTYTTPVKFKEALEGSRSFALTTHQHHLGTRMRVWHADDASDTEGPPVADSDDWANPPLEIFDPPLVFGDQGKRGLAYQCAWANPTPRAVTFGESVDDEMCLLWHYYYPSRGFHRVVQP